MGIAEIAILTYIALFAVSILIAVVIDIVRKVVGRVGR